MANPNGRPALQLIREGNPGHRTKERLEKGLRLPPLAPSEPEWMEPFLSVRGDKAQQEVAKRCRLVARRAWRTVVPVLDRMGMLSTIDEGALLDYCICRARVDQAERQLSREGMTMSGERGQQRNGAAIIGKGYRDRLRHLEVQLGLTPLARDSLRGDPGGAGDDDASPFDV